MLSVWKNIAILLQMNPKDKENRGLFFITWETQKSVFPGEPAALPRGCCQSQSKTLWFLLIFRKTKKKSKRFQLPKATSALLSISDFSLSKLHRRSLFNTVLQGGVLSKQIASLILQLSCQLHFGSNLILNSNLWVTSCHQIKIHHGYLIILFGLFIRTQINTDFLIYAPIELGNKKMRGQENKDQEASNPFTC